MLRVDKMSITEFPKTFSYGLVTNIESDHKPSVSKVVTSEEGWGLSQDTEAKWRSWRAPVTGTRNVWIYNRCNNIYEFIASRQPTIGIQK